MSPGLARAFFNAQFHVEGRLMYWDLFGFIVFGGLATVASLAAFARYCIRYIAKW
jgi:hypothetical protein